MPTSGSSMLDVRDLDVFYGLVPALHQVRLEVAARETVCLLGPNGAGKTTTVKSIIGLLKPRAGTIRWDGADITGLPPHVTVGLGLALAPEGRLLFPDMSVEENLELGASPARARPEQRQTQEIGRALMARPRLLILDEPSLGLSPLLVQELFRVLGTLNQQGMSVLIVEQNVVQALRISQRAYVLESGKIVLHGPSEELRSSDTIRKSYLGL